MPSSDLILNVKQVAGYPPAAYAQPTDSILIQQGGPGGPYASIAPETLLASTFKFTDALSLPGSLSVFSVSGGSLLFSNGVISAFTSSSATITSLNLNAGWLNGEALATVPFVARSTVTSFNFKRGDVVLDIADLLNAGGAPLYSPNFQGCPTAPTPSLDSNSNQIATTAFVQQAVGGYLNYWVQNTPLVTTFNGRSGDVVLTQEDIINAGGGANDPFNNTALTGIPTAPTAPPLTNNNQIATTQYVDTAITSMDLSNYAPLNSPNFTGYVTAPTAPPGTSDGQVATTAFVHAAVVAATTGVSSFNTRTGAVVLTGADITSAGGALLASPAFSGNPTAPTAAVGDHSTSIATTAFVAAALAGGGVVTSFNTRTGAISLTTADITGAGGAPTVSPALTGTPTAPTASTGNSSTQIATTAFVANAISALGGVVSSFNNRSGAVTLVANDISAAGGAVLASPAFSGVPTAPTAVAGTNTAQIATTSFVQAALAAGQGVSSFNGRTGAITLTSTDVTGAGGAPLANPTFTGVPSGPTAAVGTSNTQLATTAFVSAAIAAGAVVSLNGRTGTVTLLASDITGAGGALLASPALTGTPTAPTAATATNTTQIATTAFVQAAINAIGSGVTSFNTRTGAVTLLQNDISAAGGAVLASPAFTGNPTAPTQPPGNNTTNLATTAFVSAAISAAGYLPLTGGRVNINQTTAPTADGYALASGTQPGLTAQSIYGPFYGGGAPLFDNIRAVTLVPATSTNLANFNGVASYLTNQNPLTSGGLGAGVALYGLAVAAAVKAAVWGLNTVCGDNVSTQTGNQLIGYEADFNVKSTSTTVYGVLLTGASSVQPAGAIGYTCGSLGGTAKWNAAFQSNAGVAQTALVCGAAAASGSSVSSQPIQFGYFNSSGVANSVTLSCDAAGNINPSGGMIVNGLLTAASTGGISVTNGQVVINKGSAANPVLWFNDGTSNRTGLYFNVASGNTTLIDQFSGGNIQINSAGVINLNPASGQQVQTSANFGCATLNASGNLNFGGGSMTLSNVGGYMTANNGFTAPLLRFTNNDSLMNPNNVYVVGDIAQMAIVSSGSSPSGLAFQCTNAANTVAYFIWVDAGSDARIKHNIRPTEVDALAAILSIPVRQFEFDKAASDALRRGPSPRVASYVVPLGLVAQEVGGIIPDMDIVVPQPEGHDSALPTDLHAIVLPNAVPYLIRAVQQLEERVRQLETRTLQ